MQHSVVDGRVVLNDYLRPAEHAVAFRYDAVQVRLDGVPGTDLLPALDHWGSWRLGRLSLFDACSATAATVASVPSFRGPGDILMGTLIEGTGTARFGAEEVRLSPGTVAFYSDDVPFRLRFEKGWHYVVTRLGQGRAEGKRRVGDRRALHAPATSPKKMLGLAEMLGSMAAYQDGFAGATRSTFGDAVEALSFELLDDILRLNDSPASSSLADRVVLWIDGHLSDDLSPGEIARVHHISVGYLHRTLSAQGRTVARLVLDRRLAALRNRLLDPLRRDDPIALLGAELGLTDPAHLSKTFRDRYGISPRELRRQLLDRDAASQGRVTQ